MKWLFLVLTITGLSTDPGKISKINSLKSQAKKAYRDGDYKTAINHYKILKDSLGVAEDELTLNLANAYFQQNDTTNALSSYQEIAQSENKSIQSRANQQLGVMSNRLGKKEEALNYFKQAIKADPANPDARYNYEMLKKQLEKEKQEEEKKKQEQKQDNQQKDKQEQKQEDEKKSDQQKKDQQKQDEKKSENKDENSKKENEKNEEQKKKEEQKDSQKPSDEKKETPPSVSEKLQQMKISEEKAKMLLEAMKNQEVQYLQQNKRKATKPKDKNKPDW